ncbi:MAG: hypothetical protein AAGA30_11505 [Planctomycetota bacterium]
MTLKKCIFSLLAICAPLTSQVMAEDIVGGTDLFIIEAVQDVTLFSGTAINSGAELNLAGVTGTGLAGWTREQQVGDSITLSSVTGWAFSGAFSGPQAAFGSYQFGAVGGTWDVDDLVGSIGSVTQDSNDPGFSAGAASSFESGTLTLSADAFGFEFLTGPLAGVVLETDPSQGFEFQSALTSLPPEVGTTIFNSGEDVLNVLFNGAVVGTSSNRTLVVTAAVPEPSGAIVLLAFGTIAFTRRRVRR